MATIPARADASAWLFVGGGSMVWKENNRGVTANGTMTIDVGAGTTPNAPFIVGGLVRLQPIFRQGTDLSLLARVCTHGFQAGDFGLAMDLGGYARTWGVGSGGFAGGVVLGAPLGFSLSLQAEIGSDNSQSFAAVAGIDLLRLTVYRETLLNWWMNPSPGKTRRPSI